MRNPFSKVLGLFTSKADTSAQREAETSSSCCSAPEANQNKSDSKGKSSAASPHHCCGHSDTTKLPNIE